MSIRQYKGGHPSQNGETNIITECIKRIGLKTGTAIEFGAPTREYCSNIYHLIKEDWICLYFDSNPQEEGIVKAFITPENVNDIVTPTANIASFDTDGNDFAIWEAYKGRPDIVIVEINSSIDPETDYFDPKDGASFSIMNSLAKSKGYFLLIHTGNCIYIANKHKKLFPDADTSFDKSWLK